MLFLRNSVQTFLIKQQQTKFYLETATNLALLQTALCGIQK